MFELHRYKKHYLEYEPFSKQIIDVTLVQLLSKPDVLFLHQTERAGDRLDLYTRSIAETELLFFPAYLYGRFDKVPYIV